MAGWLLQSSWRRLIVWWSKKITIPCSVCVEAKGSVGQKSPKRVIVLLPWILTLRLDPDARIGVVTWWKTECFTLLNATCCSPPIVSDCKEVRSALTSRWTPSWAWRSTLLWTWPWRSKSSSMRAFILFYQLWQRTVTALQLWQLRCQYPIVSWHQIKISIHAIKKRFFILMNIAI